MFEYELTRRNQSRRGGLDLSLPRGDRDEDDFEDWLEARATSSNKKESSHEPS